MAQNGRKEESKVNEEEHGLKRHEDWISPYLTCSECNSIAFIDSRIVERALQASRRAGCNNSNSDSSSDCDSNSSSDEEEEEEEEVEEEEDAARSAEHKTGEARVHKRSEIEPLPSCPGCGRTHTWRIGALDLSVHIRGNAKARRRLERLKRRVVVRIQAVARGVRDRRLARRLRQEKAERDAWEAYNATVLAAVYRGRLDRRAAVVERSLAQIRQAHRMVMSEALRASKGKKVFWYKRRAELKLLHKDYRLLVERKGHDPPLHRVEANVNEIARRVSAILCLRAAKIQARVRGIIGRKFIRQYRIERAFVLAKQCCATLKLQRCYRAWRARQHRWTRATRRRKEQILVRYRKESRQSARTRGSELQRVKVLAAYRREVPLEWTAKKLHGATVRTAQQLLRWQTQLRDEQRRETRAASALRSFHEQKVAQNPVFSRYYDV